MNHKETSYERNLGPLIRGSCGPDIRVTPNARRQLRQRLLNEYCVRSAPDEFPQLVLSILTGVLLMLVIGGVWTSRGRDWWPINSTVLSLLVALVGLNLLCLPTAGLIIILRRRWKSCLSV